MLMLNKKGQPSGAAAGMLVGIILLIIIFYVLFLPPEERKELLGDEEPLDTEGPSSTITEPTKTQPEYVFSINPGRIDYRALDEYEYDLPAFTLFKTTSAKELERINNFYIRNGWFDKKTKEVKFWIKELENTDNILLSFITKKHKGVLSIELNGELIYEYGITSINPAPIELKKRYLKRGENKLFFSVSGVGARFWTTNEYGFEDVKILGDITDISRQESQNTFYVSSEEGQNIEKAVIKFNPECRPEKVGILDVRVNGKTIFSGIPDCGILNSYPIPPNSINIGKNKVVFKTASGSYLVDQITVETELKEPSQPIYYFELDDDLFKGVKEKEEVCGEVDGICPDGCDEDADKDCCFEEYANAYWCDSKTGNSDDRCVGYVDSTTCDRCPSGYEDERGRAPEVCEELCGDDKDGKCPSGCDINYDKDCCFDQEGYQYWCNDLPTNGISFTCVNSVSYGECEICPTGYNGESRSPECPPTEKDEGEEELKKAYDIILEFNFVDDNQEKEADVYINGRKTGFSTREDSYSRNIDNLVVSGTNSIKIVPKTVLDIRELKVRVE
jgi:hypothetical protein